MGTNCQVNSQVAWDAVEERVKAGYKGPKGETASTINDDLRKCKDTIDMVFQYYEVNDKIPAPSEVQQLFKERMSGILPKRPEPEKKKREQKPKEPDILTVFDVFTRKSGEKNAWADATFAKMAGLRTDIASYFPKIKLSELDEDTLTGFITYLRDEKKILPSRKKKGEEEKKEDKKKVRIGLNNSTIKKKLENLTWFLRWARDNGYAVHPAFKTFTPTLKQTQKTSSISQKKSWPEFGILTCPAPSWILSGISSFSAASPACAIPTPITFAAATSKVTTWMSQPSKPPTVFPLS